MPLRNALHPHSSQFSGDAPIMRKGGTRNGCAGWRSTTNHEETVMHTRTTTQAKLAGSALAAVFAAALALPASAQTATNPTDNGAGCSGTAANEAACANNQSNTRQSNTNRNADTGGGANPPRGPPCGG